MTLKEAFYPEAKFGGFTDIDGTIAFFTRVNALLSPDSVVLDVGCGRGAYGEGDIPLINHLRILKGRAKKVIGIDVDPAAKDNPYIDEFHQINGNRWPIEDNCVNLLVCDSVVEHIQNPEYFFKEIQRVLAKGGYCCIRTPNAWSYVAICAKLIPNKHHCTVKNLVQRKYMEEDVFPTYYKCNTVGKIQGMLKRHGCDSTAVYGYEAEPGYLSFSRIAYFFGVLHQKFAPRCFRPVLFAFGKKCVDTSCS